MDDSGNKINLPTVSEAENLLRQYVRDGYQRHHASMVARAMEGYADHLGEDTRLWWTTGYLHDIDFEKHPDTHPADSLRWFAQWGYPKDLMHAVEAHAYGYNGFSTLPKTKLAGGLLACDEICGIFYAYQKMNPVPYGQMKVKSIRKKIKDKSFAAKVDRSTIYLGCENLGIQINEHIANLIRFLGKLP
ncbi:MAG: HDIG domain-containing protein [Opitutae bacterium]|nr:HDIG domain-containing protein [Opitutae bacterium]